MKNISQKELLTSFFSECESKFRFLERCHDFKYFSGLVQYKKGRHIITPYTGEDVSDDFWLATRYEKESMSIELSYMAESLALECCFYFDHIYRLSLQEILCAAKKVSYVENDPLLISQSSQIESKVKEISDAIYKNRNEILDPSMKIIEKAVIMQEKIMEQNIREQYKKDMFDVSALAARAYMLKDFQKVIQLFRPYEQDLGSSDRKKLSHARNSIINRA